MLYCSGSFQRVGDFQLTSLVSQGGANIVVDGDNDVELSEFVLLLQDTREPSANTV